MPNAKGFENGSLGEMIEAKWLKPGESAFELSISDCVSIFFLHSIISDHQTIEC